MHTTIDAAGRVEAARARYDSVLERQRELAGPDGPRGATRIAADADLNEEKVEAARELRDAEQAFTTERVATENETLAGLVDDYREAVEAVRAQQARADERLAQLIDECWLLQEAAERELELARKMRASAVRATQHVNSTRPGEDTRIIDTIKRHWDDHTPAALGADGSVTEWVDRPEVGFFGDDRRVDPWGPIGELINAGRKRGLLNAGRYCREAIERAVKTRNAAGRNA
jgi:hypothetical protein